MSTPNLPPNQPPGPSYPPPGSQYPPSGLSYPPPPGAPYPPPGPPYPPPPRKTHKVRNIILGSLAAVVLLIIIIAVANGGNSGSTTATSSPAAKDSTPPPTPSLSAAEQKFTHDAMALLGISTGASSILTAGHDACAALNAGSSESDLVKATEKARPDWSSKQASGFINLAATELCPGAVFTPQTLLDISGSGDYTTEKFTVGGSGDYDIYWSFDAGSQGTANFSIEGDGGSDSNVNDPNQLSSGGSGVVHVYSDPGTHYLVVGTEADSWKIKVVTAK